MGRLIRGILLVAGTSIGAGMLALPVMTGQAGFVPSLAIYLVCWLFMACTGLLFLEISQWMPEEANIVSMAKRTLGNFGKVAAWVLYIFLFYNLTLAYIVGIGSLISSIFPGGMHGWQAQLLFLLCYIPLVYAGTRIVTRFNILLMLGLGASYLVFLWLGFQYVNMELLTSAHWSKVWIALPITFTAFAYQGIVPTLVSYMKRDIPKIRLAIIIGSFLPFITYALWQWLIMGIVPAEGAGGLIETQKLGQSAVYPLKNILNIPGLYLVGQYFAFFALVTSFFGVSLGLMDFLADGLSIKKTVGGKFLLCLLVFIPPFCIALVYPHVFLTALEYAGGFGCALLLGLLPVLMVWRGRYHLGLQGEFRVPGGHYLLIGLAGFVVIELICEIGNLMK